MYTIVYRCMVMIYIGSFVVSLFVFSHFCVPFISVKFDFEGRRDVCNVSAQSVTINTARYWKMSKGHVHSQPHVVSVILRNVLTRMSPMAKGLGSKKGCWYGTALGTTGQYLGIGQLLCSIWALGMCGN